MLSVILDSISIIVFFDTSKPKSIINSSVISSNKALALLEPIALAEFVTLVWLSTESALLVVVFVVVHSVTSNIPSLSSSISMLSGMPSPSVSYCIAVVTSLQFTSSGESVAFVFGKLSSWVLSKFPLVSV